MNTDEMPAAALQPSRPHVALIWLIRGTGAVIAIPSAMAICFIVVVFPILIIINHHPSTSGWMQIGIGFAIMFLGLPFYGLIAKFGYDMFREVKATTIANFSFIFSFLTAYALYHLLPLSLPKILADYMENYLPLLGQGGGPGFSYRLALAIIGFFILYSVVKAYLLRVLELTPPNHSQSPP
ncbi:MAG: hypothetical protein LV481_08240 [Methylacidiphilales bacterium]|nr:hypothetical protein [Candidatus Methylacidiphilales bacterium]